MFCGCIGERWLSWQTAFPGRGSCGKWLIEIGKFTIEDPTVLM